MPLYEIELIAVAHSYHEMVFDTEDEAEVWAENYPYEISDVNELTDFEVRSISQRGGDEDGS